MARPAFRAVGAVSTGTASTLAPAVPTHLTDDILLCFVGSSANASVTPTHAISGGSGTWTLLGTAENTSGTTRSKTSVYWRRAASGAESAPTVTFTPTGATACHHSAVIQSWANCVTSGDPFEGASNAQTAGAAAQALTLTTTGADRRAVAAVMHADNVATAVVTTSNPYAQRVATDSATGIDGFLWVGDRPATNGSGNGVTATFTSGGTGVGISGVCFALIPNGTSEPAALDAVECSPANTDTSTRTTNLVDCTGSYRIGFWFSWDAAGSFGKVFQFTAAGTSLEFQFSNGSGVGFWSQNGGGLGEVGTLLQGVKYFIGFSRDDTAGTSIIYVREDGGIGRTIAAGHPSDFTATAMNVGSTNGGDDFHFAGLQVHGAATDLAGFDAQSAQLDPVTLTSINGYYAMQTAAAFLTDTSGNGYNNSNQGAASRTTVTGGGPQIPLAPGGTDYTITADPGAFTVAGTAATLRAARRVTADPGAMAIAGTAAALRATRQLVADPGAVVIAGTAAVLRRGYPLTADPGAVDVTGTAADLRRAAVLTAAPGAVTVAGTAADLRATRVLAADPGAVDVSGTAATLRRGYPLTADPGAVTVAGTAAELRAARRLTADPGAVTIAGTVATLLKTSLLQADPGAVLIVGTDATLIVGVLGVYSLDAEPGAVTVAGTAASLRAARRLVAAPGAVVVAGTNSDLLGVRRLAAAPGAVLVSGTAASLEYSKRLVADPGAVLVAGAPATFFRTFVATAAPGAVLVEGTPAQLRATRLLSAAPGAVLVTGAEATLRRGYPLNAEPGAVVVQGTAAALLAFRRLAATPGAVLVLGTNAKLTWSEQVPLKPGYLVALVLDGPSALAVLSGDHTVLVGGEGTEVQFVGGQGDEVRSTVEVLNDGGTVVEIIP